MGVYIGDYLEKPYKEAECYDTGDYLYAFIHLKDAPMKDGLAKGLVCTKCGRSIETMQGHDEMMGKFWVTHLECPCGEEAIRIVGPGKYHEAPYGAEDDDE